MPDGGRLAFTLPESWRITTQAIGVAIKIELAPAPAESGDFLIVLAIIPVMSDSGPSSPQELRAAVLRSGEEKLNAALQDAIELTEVRGDHVYGYIYHLTDRNPEKGPDDYREAHQGMLRIGEYAASVTILTHSEDSATPERAIATLRSITPEVVGFGRTADGSIYRLAAPGRTWSVQIDLTGFDIQAEGALEDDLGKMVRAKNGKRDIVVSVFLEKEPSLQTAEECRAYYWAKDQSSPIAKDDVRLTERGELRVVEWTVKKFMGQRVNQRNLKAFLAHEGYCVDVHISKSGFKPKKDQKFFDELLASVGVSGQ